MRAVVMRGFGPPDVLHVEDVPVPRPAEGEVLIQVHAVSINRTLDVLVRRDGNNRNLKLPTVLGVDPSGVVVAVGPGVRDRLPGDRVGVVNLRCGSCAYCLAGEEEDCQTSLHLGIARWGGYAEYVSVAEAATVRLPDDLPFAEATVILRHFPTAFALARRGTLRAGEWALVMGAAGALGACCVQVAKRAGAHVIAAAGTDERVAAAVANGADAGVNYREQDLAAEVMRITGGHGADVVFENIADPTLWTGAFNSLAYRGRLVTAGAHGGGRVEIDVSRLYLQRLRIIGGPGNSWGDVECTLEAARSSSLKTTISRVLPLESAAEAHGLVENTAVLGKIILDPTYRR
jgi:NADPH:quinone reductase-like Zn-dependent oxidoreductase